MFVFATMLEFAGMLFLQRMNGLNECTEIGQKVCLRRSGTLEMQNLGVKIDGVDFGFIFIILCCFQCWPLDWLRK